MTCEKDGSSNKILEGKFTGHRRAYGQWGGPGLALRDVSPWGLLMKMTLWSGILISSMSILWILQPGKETVHIVIVMMTNANENTGS